MALCRYPEVRGKSLKAGRGGAVIVPACAARPNAQPLLRVERSAALVVAMAPSADASPAVARSVVAAAGRSEVGGPSPRSADDLAAALEETLVADASAPGDQEALEVDAASVLAGVPFT